MVQINQKEWRPAGDHVHHRWVVGGEWVVSGCIGLHVNRVHHCVARELDTPLGYTYQSAPDQLLEHIIRHAWVV